MRGPSAGEIADRLRGAIDRLAPAVLPGGKIEGNEWVAHGPDGAKWSVVLRGRKAGLFSAWAAGLAGDPLELVRHGICAGDRKAAYAWSLAWLGEPPKPGQPARIPVYQTSRVTHASEVDPRTVLAVFLAGQPLDWSDPVGQYLRGRGLTQAVVDHLPAALRFNPECWHGPTRRRLPAMVGAIVDPLTGRQIATHRTWIAPDPGGLWCKARVSPAKASLGSFAGGVIPLARGESGKRLKQAPAGDRAVIAEGIENTLSLAAAFRGWRLLAAVSVGNLPAISLPPGIEEVMLVCDRDGENDGVRRARTAALARWESEGRATSIWQPPVGFKDANDMLQGKQNHG